MKNENPLYILNTLNIIRNTLNIGVDFKGKALFKLLKGGDVVVFVRARFC